MTTGLVFDIQRFSIHDGEGLRTVVFLKGCSLRCPWCANPESINRSPEFLYQETRCMSCRDCLSLKNGPMSDISGSLVFSPQTAAEEARSFLCPTGALDIAGDFRSAQDIADIVERDALFFDKSRGGVTFSGGEPLLQAEFVAETARLLREKGISSAVETCLHVPRSNIDRILPAVDELLCDIKHTDPVVFRRHTGGDLALIEKNFRRIIESGVPLRARVPVIYGFNDDEQSLKSIIRKAAEWGVTRIDLLPYHSLGASKSAMLGREYGLPLTIMAPEILEPYREFAEENGITATIGG